MRDQRFIDTPQHVKRARSLVARLRVAACVCLLAMLSLPARAISFQLDSIAQWGAFPRLCVNTYRWADRVFNTFDTTYVQSTGEDFGLKTRIDTWTDTYDFRLADGYLMRMSSDPTALLGFYVSCMSVSVGYDFNIGKHFGGSPERRERFNLQFKCALLGAEYYNTSNHVGSMVTHMGMPGDVHRVNQHFSGIDNRVWGLDVYYFFNHRHYSQSAAFSYGRIQRKSAGSPFAGLTFSGQRYNFDFSELAWMAGSTFPLNSERSYRVRNHDYFVKLGYAYNWVFHPGWCVGLMAAPSVGLRQGYINQSDRLTSSFGLKMHGRLSLVYNLRRRWYFGAVGRIDSNLIYDKTHTMLANNLSVEFSAGYRFNIW